MAPDDHEPSLFTYTNSAFYEPIDAYEPESTYEDALLRLLPDAWSTHREGIWLYGRKAGQTPARQGFKIHVSSTPECAETTLDCVVPPCVDDAVNFKVVGDPQLHLFQNSKTYGRAGAGKFMTIYPRSTKHFTHLIQALYDATNDRDLEGPYILSDRRYRDSPILFYRYGGIRPRRRLQADGTRKSVIETPDGDLVRDERVPHFHLPDWVDDPFADGFAEDAAADAGETSSTGASDPEEEAPAPEGLNGRYVVEGALKFSNTGGVYQATDAKTGEDVVLKEARPHTGQYGRGDDAITAIDIARHEYQVLRKLDAASAAPRAFDLFREWEHLFLVEEQVPGVTLRQFFVQTDNILAPFVRHPGRIEAFLPTFTTVALGLIDALEEIHDAGVIYGDLSPTNVVVNDETLELSLIDFETAVSEETSPSYRRFAQQWVTVGFTHPEQVRNPTAMERAGDFYAAGRTLYSTIVGVQPVDRVGADAADVALDRYVDMGIPAAVKTAIDALCANRPDEARHSLRTLRSRPSVAAG